MKYRLPILAASLATWYACTSNSSMKERDNKYVLPECIVVKESSLPTQTLKHASWGVLEESSKKNTLEKVVMVKDIDFSRDFSLKTERYTFTKTEDWLPSRAVGHVMSLPHKLFFWDWDISIGPDSNRAKATLAMLENNKDIKDITVRVGHNEALYDGWRMFTDKKLRERNNFVSRLLFGIPITLKNELLAELFRGDYYNPLTQTAVVYSNLECVSAHEIGHHKDFQRYTSDWEYLLFRALPPVMLYQEWKASTYAKDFLSNEDKYQFNRYLMPAFLTYCLATIGTIGKIFKKIEDEDK